MKENNEWLNTLPEKVFINLTKQFNHPIEFGLNKETKTYECFLKIPIIDEVGKEILISERIHFSVPAVYYQVPIIRRESLSMMTKDELAERDLKKEKITILKELVAKIENL